MPSLFTWNACEGTAFGGMAAYLYLSIYAYCMYIQVQACGMWIHLSRYMCTYRFHTCKNHTWKCQLDVDMFYPGCLEEINHLPA